ncbi:hypothetical protein BDP55DRAFT_651635 [Colletotrichum godetiae]|uniref:Uncharacterized protein n=1 Tax=Colletotrichum godetiae TaxID=1209918 RepID=A0AAJ0ASY2_9PEZI|nr:uncharacterized protein BDP55DRAFT_651635 [Colletotrichum godetiae]KAK1689790.1 hypothetical protein BDP55DRAFT_651635 [Colletotrichum godetiae]
MTHQKNRSSRFGCFLLVPVAPSERGWRTCSISKSRFFFPSLEPTRSASLVQPNRC